jgi:alanine dehydrogenase
MGAQVVIMDHVIPRLCQLDNQFGARITTVLSMADTIEQQMLSADLVIGAVLIPGATAPRLVTKEMLGHMRPGAVMLDVSIDQGGCFETSRPTTHTHPTYLVDGIVHYCVTNMPSIVPRTSTLALNHATLPFVQALAHHGYKEALQRDCHLLNGLHICQGQITHPAVAAALRQPFTPAKQLIST